MKTYIDRFEIEAKRPNEAWKHVGTTYPKYEWKIRRPWHYLWLVRRWVIINEIVAWATCFGMTIRNIHALPESEEKVRLVIWLRQGKKLIRAGAMEPC